VESRRPFSRKYTLFLLGLGIWLGARTFSRGDDFLVFFRTALGFFKGISPYDTAVYGNMVFKYPPWILPFFLPLAALSLPLAKGVFVVFQAISLFLISGFLKRDHGVSERFLGFGFLFFLPLLLIQAMVGQLSLFLLAGGLWLSRPKEESSRFQTVKTAMMTLLFSVKLLTLFPLLTIFFPEPSSDAINRGEGRSSPDGTRSFRAFRVVLFTFLAASLFSLPLLVFFKGSVSVLLHEWFQSMFSGTHDIQSVRIGFTTREAQGFPSLILRAMGWDEREKTNILLALFISIGAVLGGFFFFLKRLSPGNRTLLLLALTPLIQPLAWFHFYLLVFPLSVILISEFFRERNRRGLVLVFLCTFFLTAVTEKTFGEFGLMLEFGGVKTWATLGLALLFVRRKGFSGASL
jgi:hypothetical protein